jgi:hypothetical protein
MPATVVDALRCRVTQSLPWSTVPPLTAVNHPQGSVFRNGGDQNDGNGGIANVLKATVVGCRPPCAKCIMYSILHRMPEYIYLAYISSRLAPSLFLDAPCAVSCRAY